jgi:TonB-dependent starch-binding outer membrane protein SusC
MQDFVSGKASFVRGGQNLLLLKWEKSKTLRIMKLTAFFLVAIALNVSAKGLAQEKITLSLKDALLEKVFDQIEVQTGFVFLYKNETIRNKTVSIQVTNASLTQVLDLCLKDLSLVYKVVGKSVAIKPMAISGGIEGISEDNPSPLIDVHGKVINEKGDPVAGVTVTIKGSNTSIATDENGEFSLSSVDKQAVLVFTSVNMETFELVVNGKTNLTISLKTKVSALENVQVTASTGYQTIKPNEATGSFSIVDNKMLNQQVGINVLKRLDGMTTSVLFDTKPSAANKRSNITIRGFSSINGPLDPLIVLDGFIYEGNINNINPSIVESITLLKDASAASIWGARAGNGVIVITTKKGNFNQKMQVEVNANVIVSSKPDLFYLPQMSSGDYIDVEQFLYSKGHYNDALNNINRPAVSPAVEIFRKRALNQISAADSADLINSLKANDIRNEYNKHFYQNAVTQQYAMNLRGGTANSAYILSLGYDRSNSELDNLYKRINVKFENIYRPIKNMQATVGLYYTNSKDLSGKPGYNNVLVGGATVPYLKFADDNGNSLPVALSVREAFTDTAGAGKLLDWKYYPLQDYKHDRTATNLNELFANVGLQYKIFKFLSVDLKYQYQRQQTEKLEIQDIESFATRNRINLFSQLNRSTGIVKYIVPLGGIQTANNNTIESQTYRGQFNFNNSWGMHELVAILGGEVRQTHGSGNRFTTYGYNTDPLSNGIVDFKNPYPTFLNNSNQFIPGCIFC